MTIRYEANPPKILPGIDPNESIQKFVEKIKIISNKCDAIHLTENVLGFQRVSPIEVGRIIRKEIPNLPITVSLRVRDKSEMEISEFVEKCVSIGFSGILILMIGFCMPWNPPTHPVQEDLLEGIYFLEMGN